ncbi:YqgE/AlgH family protein [Bacteroidales bacterium OttesenSCG-928-B11]|nr:YqgE/AlgH family protein [Bacteroidales bacterium OttesenSCG-928-E04]MDL2308217.1 YqgE/AlgH family protein [Bacteroidales bacterium OttesenSCG-928-C03]MDL2311517.1 YqgE/AlgH family protein [Bacteroidales bacterium OttesenSCG-928-B11]MDL2325656.1 YqgE/AlgH family protein [Bacteroidales bacterium OttesenSCG-928-A14]
MRFPTDFMKVNSTGLEPAVGRVLISVPFYNDIFFNRAVVLLTDYSPESTVGLILNKPSDSTVNEIIPSIKIDESVYLGGPVLSEMLFGIHNHRHGGNEPPLLKNVYVGYDDILLALIENDAIPQLRYKFFVGYSGWSPGQLDDEISRSMWVVSQENEEFIFNTSPEKMWETAVKNLGQEYRHWLSFPKHIEDN